MSKKEAQKETYPEMCALHSAVARYLEEHRGFSEAEADDTAEAALDDAFEALWENISDAFPGEGY